MPRKSKNLFSLWEELKRRKVVKASIVYLAVAFGILQAVDIIFPRMGLPEWTVNFVLMLLIIVFILVIILTWVFDITPEGIQITQTLDEKTEEKPSSQTIIQELADMQGIVAEESDLRKKITVLEDQLKEARLDAVSAREIRKKNIKKLLFSAITLAFLLLVVFYRQNLTHMLGLGEAKRKLAMEHNANAVTLIKSGNYEAAGSELEIALESDPGYSYAWGNMAVVSYKQGNTDKAVNQIIKAINLDPKNSYAPYNLAIALQDKNDYKQAIRWYKEAIKIDSTYRRDTVYTVSCSGLGNLFNSIDQPIDAILILNRAMDQFPRSKYNYLIYKNLGNAYLIQEQNDSALKYLELSRNINPREPQTNYLLAKAYESSGQLSKSIEIWESYIGLETDSAKAAEARKHLKEITIRHLQEIIK